MAKTREITIRESLGAFSLFGGEKSISKDSYDFDGLDSLKKLLSKEKARMLDAIKHKKPSSIYQLAKILNRPFKATFNDVKLLERFGFVKILKEKEKNREKSRPVISTDHIIIHVKI